MAIACLLQLGLLQGFATKILEVGIILDAMQNYKGKENVLKPRANRELQLGKSTLGDCSKRKKPILSLILDKISSAEMITQNHHLGSNRKETVSIFST